MESAATFRDDVRSVSQNGMLAWLWIAVVEAVVAAVRHFGDFSTWETRLIVGGLFLAAAAKLLTSSRGESTSVAGMLTLFLGLRAVVIVALVGLPHSWMRLPDPMKVVLALLPVFAGFAAFAGFLMTVARLEPEA